MSQFKPESDSAFITNSSLNPNTSIESDCITVTVSRLGKTGCYDDAQYVF